MLSQQEAILPVGSYDDSTLTHWVQLCLWLQGLISCQRFRGLEASVS